MTQNPTTTDNPTTDDNPTATDETITSKINFSTSPLGLILLLKNTYYFH
jgi:hypothetical protein